MPCPDRTDFGSARAATDEGGHEARFVDGGCASAHGLYCATTIRPLATMPPEGGRGMTQAKALLYVQMNPPTDAAAERSFHAWYEDHMAVRREMPGILNAQRYRNVDPEGPRHLAWYDLADASALRSPEYLALRAREAETPRDQQVHATILFSERRLYRCIDTDEPWAAARDG